MEQKWIIELADEQDARAILDLQRLAYQSEAAIYDDYTIAPLTQTLEETLADFEQQVVLKATMDGRIVGSVRGRLRGDSCEIGRLIVHPDLQNRGIGTALMNRIEQHFPAVRRFELCTGHASERNLYLYGRLGYRAFDRRPVSNNLTMVLMEKSGATGPR